MATIQRTGLRGAGAGVRAGALAASVPCGFSPGEMPIGLQIIGKPFDEATVLRVADAFERNTEWHRKYPPIAEYSGARA